MPAHHLSSPRPRRLTVLLAGVAIAAVFTAAAPVAAYADPSADAPQGSARAGVVPAATPTLTGLAHEAATRQRELATAQAAYQSALDERATLTVHALALRGQAELASARAAALREQVAHEPMGGMIDSIASFVGGHESTMDQAVEAVDNEQHALSLVQLAERAVHAADANVSRTRRALAAAREAAARVEAEKDAEVAARHASLRAQFGRDYDVEDRAQDSLNRRALARWQHYLARLGGAGIAPPDAISLSDPDRLPAAFEPVRDRRGRPVPGVAKLERHDRRDLVVLPAETIRAVSEAFSLVGRPPAATTVAGGYACGGMAAVAWHPTSFPLADTAVSQWRDLRPVPAGQRQVGDLVFVAGDGTGPDLAAVYLGAGLMIAASPQGGVPAVQRVAEATAGVVLGTRRVPLSARTPSASTASIEVSCDTDPVLDQAAPAFDAGDGWTWPVSPGSYVLSTGFGVSGPLWSSGQHTGQDFAAPVGTPVHAARAGVVTVQHPSWAGNLVRIEHADGLETWYAHLSAVTVATGQQVDAGSLVGAVGDEGNSTGPHLHFEVRVEGRSVDPMAAFSPQG